MFVYLLLLLYTSILFLPHILSDNTIDTRKEPSCTTFDYSGFIPFLLIRLGNLELKTSRLILILSFMDIVQPRALLLAPKIYSSLKWAHFIHTPHLYRFTISIHQYNYKSQMKSVDDVRLILSFKSVGANIISLQVIFFVVWDFLFYWIYT